jgi:hypothetical protein
MVCVVWYRMMCIKSRKKYFTHSGQLLVAGHTYITHAFSPFTNNCNKTKTRVN